MIGHRIKMLHFYQFDSMNKNFRKNKFSVIYIFSILLNLFAQANLLILDVIDFYLYFFYVQLILCKFNLNFENYSKVKHAGHHLSGELKVGRTGQEPRIPNF